MDPLRDHPPVSQNLIKNPISLIGLALAGVALANIVFLVLIDLLASHPSPYIGILAYMVAPAISGSRPDSDPHRNGGRAAPPAARCRCAAPFPQARSQQSGATQYGRLSAQLRGDLRAGERGRQLQGLRVHRLGGFLRPVVPHRHASRVHGLSGLAARACGLCRMSRRIGRRAGM